KRVSDEQNDRGVTWKLEPLVAGAVAKKNSADTEKHAQVPKTRTSNEEQRISQNRPAQPRHEPDGCAHSRHGGPAIDHHVHVRRAHPSPGKKTDIKKWVRLVKLKRNKPRQQRP